VGGGSTELFYKNSSNVMFKSLNLGAVRIYLEKDHLSEWQDLEAFLASLGHIKNIVGVGGNVRSLISIINEDINNSGIWTIFAFVILGLGVTSEGVIDNIWRYTAILAGLFGIVGSGSEFITGTNIIADTPLQFVAFLTFIGGVGVGPLLAWNKK